MINKKVKLLESLIKRIVMEEKKKLNESTNIDAIDNQLERLSEKLVPRSGAAETLEGEMVRAINRVIYRYFNDGDVFFRGYGKETVLPSVRWLIQDSPLANKLKRHFSKAKLMAPKKSPGSKYNYEGSYSETDEYRNNIYAAAQDIIEYVNSKKGNYSPNTGDSR